MKKYIFPLLVALAAVVLAGAAAFFSVTGLSKLFGGAKVEVIIMASALEFAKIITASFLHRYWHKLKWHIKSYLLVGVMVVMFITSAGIYGFLSNAYSATSGKLQNIDTQIQMVDQKKSIILSDIKRMEDNKTLKSERIKSLTSLRSQQESRLDSLYGRRQIGVAKRVEAQIEQANREMLGINIEIDSINTKTQRRYNETTALDLEVLDLKNNDVNGEVGPLKYIAKLTGKDMDQVVNFFIMLLIFVFDPLAVFLIVATNIAIENEFGKEKEEEKKEGPPVNDGVTEGVNDVVNDVVNDAVNDGVTEGVTEGATEGAIEETIETEPVQQPHQKTNAEVMSYVANTEGEFEPIKKEAKEVASEPSESQQKTLNDLKIQGVSVNDANYMNYLDVLYRDGAVNVGDYMPKYSDFVDSIKKLGFKQTEKQVTDFITICNYFKITDMTDFKNNKKALILKNYSDAKKIISILC